MDYKIYALLARASYCKDSDGIILNFKACRLGETQQYKTQRNTRPDCLGKDKLFLIKIMEIIFKIFTSKLYHFGLYFHSFYFLL